MDGVRLLATAGIAYLVAGMLFRVPMPVQPLKSLVVAALALGASAADVCWSGFIVGFLCFLLSFCNPNKYASYVPRHLVHGLQLGLGVMLITKGLSGGLSGGELPWQTIFVVLSAAMIGISFYTDKPVMGWLATAGLSAGLWMALKNPTMGAVIPSDAVHFKTIISLVVPQLALTLANSIIGTADASAKYFGEPTAHRVRPASLLLSIGIGNMLSAAVGGLPFCHGAGGLTAHIKGGARTWRMNGIIGGLLLGLACLSLLLATNLIPAYPKVLMAALMLGTGYFHMLLARESWAKAELRWLIIAMGIVALISQDMLWVLAAGIGGEGIRYFRAKSRRGISKQA